MCVCLQLEDAAISEALGKLSLSIRQVPADGNWQVLQYTRTRTRTRTRARTRTRTCTRTRTRTRTRMEVKKEAPPSLCAFVLLVSLACSNPSKCSYHQSRCVGWGQVEEKAKRGCKQPRGGCFVRND